MGEFGRDYEILVLDDASTDDTREVLKRYRRSLPLRVSHSEERSLEDARVSVQERLGSLAAVDSRIYAAGWIEENEVLERYPLLREWRPLEERSLVGSRLWHTWLTGIYSAERVRLGYWFTAGTIQEGRLELRPR